MPQDGQKPPLSERTITIESDGGVRIVTLSRPELLNRFDAPLHHDFSSALDEVAADGDARAVVLASTGKVFSAGGDFDLMRSAHADPSIRRAIVDDAKHLLTTLLSVPQPVVAAVQGAAIGLGATVVLACDAVVAARTAVLADSHVNVGLVAGDGGAVVWPASAGALRARRHLLTGDPLDAETAFTLGMVTDLVDEPDETLGAALEIAGRMAALPPLAVRLTKRALNHGLLQRAGEVLDLSLAYEETTLASDDLLEAIAAFQERRPAEYRGR
jgi:enoyl-CoA hydratase